MLACAAAGAAGAKGGAVVFYGEYESKVDAKGRVIIPARLRDAVPEDDRDDGFVVRLGEDGCVTVYTWSHWQELERAVNRVPQNTHLARQYRRFVFTQADRGQCDKQGRLRIPANLLAEARIDRAVVVVGVSDQIEIWERKRWQALKSEMLAERERNAEDYPLG